MPQGENIVLSSVPASATLISAGYSNITGWTEVNAIEVWTQRGTNAPPAARWQHTAVWTGREMIIWGGETGSVPLNTGGRYNPALNAWTASSTFNPPAARYCHTAVNAGHRMLVFGGTANSFLCDDDVGAYNFPKRALYVYEKP